VEKRSKELHDNSDSRNKNKILRQTKYPIIRFSFGPKKNGRVMLSQFLIIIAVYQFQLYGRDLRLFAMHKKADVFNEYFISEANVDNTNHKLPCSLTLLS
jgi:hypothetical protein